MSYVGHSHPVYGFRAAGGATAFTNQEYLAKIINILGKRDVRMFLPFFDTNPATGDVESDLGPRSHHFINATARDNEPYVKGHVLAGRFNGGDEYYTLADHDDFSFGDSATDEAFSMGCAVRSDVSATAKLIAKMDDETPMVEYFLGLAALRPQVRLFDAVVGARIGRIQNVATAVLDEWHIIFSTYDGSGAEAGIVIYMDGVRVDDASSSAGAYTAMHNTAQEVSVCAAENAAGPVWSEFFPGDMWGPFITGKELSASEVLDLTNIYRRLLGL